MSNPINVIVIDPKAKTVTYEVLPDNTFEEAKKRIGCHWGEIVNLDGLLMIIDEEGLLVPNFHFSFDVHGWDRTPFAGTAIIVQEDKEGNFARVPDMTGLLPVIWHDNDAGLDKACKAGFVDRPKTMMGGIGPDGEMKDGEVIWQWSPNEMRS